ncbi:Stage V sporulation protein B [compost metagenome]
MSKLIRQTSIRLGAISLTKAIGFIGRIILTRLIGAEGIGLFQIAYSYFGFVLLFITGGIPTTLALYTAKDHVLGWIWFKRISLAFVLLGVGGFYFTFSNAREISSWMGNANIYYFLRALSPALFIVPLLSLFRGYLQGIERYSIIAISEVIEQLVRVLLMLILCWYFIPQGIFYAGGISMIGTSLGAATAFAALILISLYFKNSTTNTSSSDIIMTDLKWFIQSSLAISLTRLLIPLSDMIDAIIIPARLQVAGYSSNEATTLFGILTGMTLLVVYMPTLVTAAISHTMTMKLAALWKEGQSSLFTHYAQRAIEYAWTWGATATIFLWIYHYEVSLLFFGTAEPSILIKYFSIIPFLVGVREVSTSILWSQDRKYVTLIGTFIGITVAALSHYTLLPFPALNIKGAIVGILLMEGIILIANMIKTWHIFTALGYKTILTTGVFVVFSLPLGLALRELGRKLDWGLLSTLLGMSTYVFCVGCYWFSVRRRAHH